MYTCTLYLSFCFSFSCIFAYSRVQQTVSLFYVTVCQFLVPSLFKSILSHFCSLSSFTQCTDQTDGKLLSAYLCNRQFYLFTFISNERLKIILIREKNVLTFSPLELNRKSCNWCQTIGFFFAHPFRSGIFSWFIICISLGSFYVFNPAQYLIMLCSLSATDFYINSTSIYHRWEFNQMLNLPKYKKKSAAHTRKNL